MNILLISAGESSFKGALWGAYDFDLPLNVAYAAAYLEEHHYPTQVIDLQIPGENIDDIVKNDIDKFTFIGISSNLSSYREAYRIVTVLRNNNFQGRIFIFGPLGLYLQERIFDECSGIDFIVHGEEEPTILDLVENADDPQAVRGISFIIGDQKIKTDERDYIDDLDSLPFPARNKFKLKKYFPSPGKYLVLPQITMLSSRGCDYHCLFCEKTGGKRQRLRTAENIIAEIDEVVARYGAREICFLDEMFGADKDETLKLAELLIQKNYKVYLRITTRIDHIDEEVLTALKKAGLYSVGFGIESGSDDILKYNNKQITTQQVRKSVASVKRLGLETRGYFMINMPGETKQYIQHTKAFIKALKLDLINIQIAYPFPNTPFRRLVKRKYRIVPEKWRQWEYSDGDDVVFTQSDLTENLLKREYRQIIKMNYLNLKFMIRWLWRIKTFHDFKYSFLQMLNLLRV